MTLDTRNPSVEAGAPELVNLLPGGIDGFEVSPELIDLQVERLRRRFKLSEARATVTAELAFATQRRFA